MSWGRILDGAVHELSCCMFCWFNIRHDTGWYKFHIVKWAAFFPLKVYITLSFFPWYWWPILAGVCSVEWKSVYNYFKRG